MRTREEIEARRAELQRSIDGWERTLADAPKIISSFKAELVGLEFTTLPPDDGIMEWWPKSGEQCLWLGSSGNIQIVCSADWLLLIALQGNLAPNTPEARAYLEGKAKFQRYLTAGQQLRIGEDGEYYFVEGWWKTGRCTGRNRYVQDSKTYICTATSEEAEAIYAELKTWFETPIPYRLVKPEGE